MFIRRHAAAARMARAAGKTLPTLALLLAALVGVALAVRLGWLPARGGLERVAALDRLLLVALLASVALLVLLRAAGAVLRRTSRGGASTMRPFESAAAVLVVAFVVLGAASDIGSAFLSLGLAAAALTLALQRPILSLAGWSAIRFGRLFREGDRIEVEGIVGDVLDVRLLTTRLWELGSPESPLSEGGRLAPGRPTGRIVTLSNATFLEKPVANATADVDVVFDEFSVSVAYEADWRLGERLLRECAGRLIDPQTHARAADAYAQLVAGLPTPADFPREPVVLMALRDSWIELRLRYLVDARRRAEVRTGLARAWQEATEAHAERLPNVYPRAQPMQVGADGRAKR